MFAILAVACLCLAWLAVRHSNAAVRYSGVFFAVVAYVAISIVILQIFGLNARPEYDDLATKIPTYHVTLLARQTPWWTSICLFFGGFVLNCVGEERNNIVLLVLSYTVIAISVLALVWAIGNL